MKIIKNDKISCFVSDDEIVKDIEAFGKRFQAEQGILHCGSSPHLSVETEDFMYSNLPGFVRRVEVSNLKAVSHPFELWFHQDFKGQSDEQVAFYSPCEQSVIHYVDGVYFLFTVEGEGTNKSIRYALSNDARPSYQKLKSNEVSHCWQPLASGRIDSTLCLDGELPSYTRETFYFKMIVALSEDELFTYYNKMNHMDSFYSMRKIEQHDEDFEISNSVESQSC